MGDNGKAPAISPKRSIQSRKPRRQSNQPSQRPNCPQSLPKRQPTTANETHPSLEYPSLEKRYQTLRLKAERSLGVLVVSEDTPAAVRLAAARLALELCGAIGKRQSNQDDRDAELDPDSLTLESIERELGKLRQ